MLSPIIKKGKELTQEEIIQVYQLHLKYQIDASPEAAYHHIIERHVQAMEVTFYLYKWEGRVVAYHAITWFERSTPFAKKPLPIFHINMSFKDPTADVHVKNYGKRSNLHIVRQRLGRFWYLKSFVLTFNTVNPKAIDRLSRILIRFYPNGNIPPVPVLEFARKHLEEDLKINPQKISDQLMIQDDTQPWLDISQDWEKLYQSASIPLNTFFKEQGIFKEDAGKYWLKTDNFAVFIGHYHPWKLLGKKIRQRLPW